MESKNPGDIFKYGVHEDVFVCYGCLTEITLYRKMLRKYKENDKMYALFDNVVNIVDDPNSLTTNKKSTVQNIYCRICDSDLGFKSVKEDRSFLLYVDSLMLRKGGKLCDATTEQPLDDAMYQLIYDKDDEDAFKCHQCSNHITSYQELIRKYSQSGRSYTLFRNLGGIVYDKMWITNTKNTVQSVYCKTCRADLGFKFITVAEPGDDVEDGRFLLFTNKMLLSREGKLYDAATEETYEKK